jgi:hypothetical protein
MAVEPFDDAAMKSARLGSARDKPSSIPAMHARCWKNSSQSLIHQPSFAGRSSATMPGL